MAYITSHYITFHCNTLPYITLHYFTLQYLQYIITQLIPFCLESRSLSNAPPGAGLPPSPGGAFCFLSLAGSSCGEGKSRRFDPSAVRMAQRHSTCKSRGPLLLLFSCDNECHGPSPTFSFLEVFCGLFTYYLVFRCPNTFIFHGF